MCKFRDRNDANYRKFGAEVKKLYKLATQTSRSGQAQRPLQGAQS
jgi:hypothetical protein